MNRMEIIGGELLRVLCRRVRMRTCCAGFFMIGLTRRRQLILGSLRRATKPTARLIVVESVIPEGPAFNFGKWSDLQMLVCVGGRERTETEYRALLTDAGFDLQEVVATASPLSLLVAKPV